MVAGAVVKVAAKAGAKALKGAGKKTGTTSRTVVQHRDSKGRFVGQSNPGKPKGKPASGSAATAKHGSPSDVKGYWNRRYEYKMAHGPEVERTKQVGAIAGSISGAATENAAATWNESEEKTKRAKMKYDAQVESAKAMADAYKNRNVTENKNYSFSGLDQLQKGGATKTVNPSTGETYENEYSV